jgi:hypothetical protein
LALLQVVPAWLFFANFAIKGFVLCAKEQETKSRDLDRKGREGKAAKFAKKINANSRIGRHIETLGSLRAEDDLS